jgi:hypothetical protein
VTTPSHKLYGPKQIFLLISSMIAGIGFCLFRRYHEFGHLGQVDFIATGFTVVVTGIIAAVIVRKGNKEE